MGHSTRPTSIVQSESASRSRLSEDPSDEALKSLDAHRPLLAANVRWAKSVALLRHGHQVEDAWQAGRLGFLEAHRRFDPNRGITLGAFAAPFVRGAVREALEDTAHFEDITTPFELVTEENGHEGGGGHDDHEGFQFEGGPDQIEIQERKAAVHRFVRSLPERQQNMVKDVFWADRSQAEVARAHGVSRKTITKTLQKAYTRGQMALAEFRAA